MVCCFLDCVSLALKSPYGERSIKYECMYVCMYVCKKLCMYVCMYVCIKYKLELDHVIRVAVNKHVFVFHLDLLTLYSSCKLKTRQDERQGIKLPLEAIAFYSDSFGAQKINVEQKVAENWAWPRTGPLTVIKVVVVVKTKEIDFFLTRSQSLVRSFCENKLVRKYRTSSLSKKKSVSYYHNVLHR